jgi:non-heme chloroperoxidase
MKKAVSLFSLWLILCGNTFSQTTPPTKVRVRGVELTYIERGRGEPLILLHGGQGDYRSWQPQMELWSKTFRVISYSRRYHYPNNNPLISDYRSGYTDSSDLAAFIKMMKLKKVHLVGTSAGALVALKYAVDHPKMVSSLVLAEPPVHQWITGTPSGLSVYNEFMTKTWKPAGEAFRSGNDAEAMRILVDEFGGPGAFERMPPAAKAVSMGNSRFFKAATASADPFPALPREKVRRLKMPILIVRGEDTIEIHKLVNAELEKVLPAAVRAIIPKAGHGSPRENPAAFNEAIRRFYSAHKVAGLTGG